MKLLFYSLLLALTFSSCDIINPDERDPAYLTVESYTVQTTAAQGTASDNLTEMWVNASDNLVSIASVGKQIPVLNQGPTKVSIFPGIKNFGASDMRIFYPFYQPYDTVIDFQPLTYHKVNPVFTYYPNVDIDATRDFESGFNFQPIEEVNEGLFEEVNDPDIVFEGAKCAKAFLPDGTSVLYFKDDNPFPIESGNTVFLEMNYSCNQQFTVGVLSTVGGSTANNDMVNMAATASGNGVAWNKIYIDLGAIGLLYPEATAHHLYIKCIKTGGDLPIVYLDNLKIVKWP